MRFTAVVGLLLAVAAGCVSLPAEPTPDPVPEQRQLVALPAMDGTCFAESHQADPYLEAATRLQAAGKERAVATLRTLGAESAVLCRMLFKARPGVPFRSPRCGNTGYNNVCNHDGGWPLEPIALVDGVPFCIAGGFFLYGVEEPPASYVDWCAQNCDWADERFAPKTAEQKQRALEKLLASIGDSPARTESLRKMFAAQIQ